MKFVERYLFLPRLGGEVGGGQCFPHVGGL